MRIKLFALLMIFVAVLVFSMAFVSTAMADDIVCCIHPYDPIAQCSECQGWKYVQEGNQDCRCVQNPWCPWSTPHCW